MSLLLRDVVVEGRRSCVRVDGGLVTAVAPSLPRAASDDDVVAGDGGALLPGLHDHHLHLLALGRSLESVDCGPDANASAEELAARLRSAPVDNTGWVRGVGYHESVAGALDRDVLDGWVADRPVRVQHRTGALWMLNSEALVRAGLAGETDPDIERDRTGTPNGRLWRYDARLRRLLPSRPPDLALAGRLLTRAGITGVTDATPETDQAAVELLARAAAGGSLPQRITLLGVDDEQLPRGFVRGPRKLLLRDHDLPSGDDLEATVAGCHAAGRPVAVHCVTGESLVLALAAIERAGPLSGDRIEHASVIPTGIVEWIARLGLHVVTQPDLLRTRGDSYLAEADADDRANLYPFDSLVSAGVATCASSDAPFGTLDPWQVIRSAVSRATRSGHVIGPGERVQPETALAGYLSPPDDPGGRPRRVRRGEPADLVLLDRSLADAFASSSSPVRSVWIGGTRVE